MKKKQKNVLIFGILILLLLVFGGGLMSIVGYPYDNLTNYFCQDKLCFNKQFYTNNDEMSIVLTEAPNKDFVLKIDVNGKNIDYIDSFGLTKDCFRVNNVATFSTALLGNSGLSLRGFERYYQDEYGRNKVERKNYYVLKINNSVLSSLKTGKQELKIFVANKQVSNLFCMENNNALGSGCSTWQFDYRKGVMGSQCINDSQQWLYHFSVLGENSLAQKDSLSYLLYDSETFDFVNYNTIIEAPKEPSFDLFGFIGSIWAWILGLLG